MARRWTARMVWALLAFLTVPGMLAGCGGKKDAEGVLQDLERKAKSIQGYRAEGTLTLATGAHPVDYAVEVKHLKPAYYRVSLSNAAGGIRQVIVKNDDGVFVVTPNLGKTYRFQSRWPENQSQVYLFESLVRSIAADGARVFEAADDGYVFRVKAEYQNRLLSTQKIWFDKRTLAPKRVEVLDADDRPLVVLVFSRFEWNPPLRPEDFKPDAAGEKPSSSAGETAPASAGVEYREPLWRPPGTELVGVEKKPDGSYTLTYGGAFRLTISAQPARAVEVVAPSGEPVWLSGGAIGVLTRIGELTTLRVTAGGVDYKLTTVDLAREDLLRVAESLLAPAEK
ncbi:MAG: outer membrane lipoprotein carrier protein LolA [Hydrogenibacillus schlegelii]|uniref:Outer membrane lipoprotein carrier protein LolA n=1 Tax=Hydrogenibacillus schlegelii TaxID=1484 RepID=A0A947CZL7_HYDSH|nr:outer membrane lipoprotein carrier protein LolA [Hydrogenibacillus schlegelii]